MLGADEEDELRSLQARAYGSGGALSGTEAARLRELAARKTHAARVETSSMIVAVPKPRPTLPPSRVAHVPGPSSDEEAPAPVSAAGPTTPRPPRPEFPTRWRVVLVAAVVTALVAGVGAGWVLFGRSTAPAIALSAEQQQRQDDLADAGEYDPGSLRALAREDDVVLWSATRNGGETTCVLIGDAESSAVSCQVTERVRPEGLSVGLTQVGESGAGQITGRILLSLSGEPAASLELFRYDTDAEGFATSYANADEKRFASSLVRDGYTRASVQVVGYDGENPIWTASREDDGMRCLIYSILPSSSWARCAEAPDQVPRVERIDEQTGQTTRVDWRATSAGTRLVITTTESTDDVAAG